MPFDWNTAKYDWRDMSESEDPNVERSPMERGVPKQRRMNSDVRCQVDLTLHFDSAAESDDFDTWFFVTINGGQDSFNWFHKRRNVAVQARVVGGQRGPLKFMDATLTRCSRSLSLEYMRAAW